MLANHIEFRSYKSFRDEFVGFKEFKHVNIIIGRNNTGKSALLDLVQMACSADFPDSEVEVAYEAELSEAALQRQFDKGRSGGDLPGNHWEENGKSYVGATVRWVCASQRSNVQDCTVVDHTHFAGQQSSAYLQARKDRLERIVKQTKHQHEGWQCLKLGAERDIRPEKPSTSLELNEDGSGASNLVRRVLLTSDSSVSRDLVRLDLLAAMNEVFEGDAYFDEIQVQHHDGSETGSGSDTYEICLYEESKGLVPLSRSGSGLKTVLLVLVNLVVIPKLQGKEGKSFCYCFEELENNLHPALLRRLFSFIHRHAKRNDCRVFITTHSTSVIDFFGTVEDCQIFGVFRKENGRSSLKRLSKHLDKISVVRDLGGQPSDLMMSNGVIWVEGPSDRIYINRWIEILSKGNLREGAHYQIAFYGGALLSRAEFSEPEMSVVDFVNLLTINPNFALVCDGDRTAPTGKGSRIKKRVSRVRGQVEDLGFGYVWVTAAKEIENYLPTRVLSELADREVKRAPGQYEQFWPSSSISKQGSSYLEKVLARASIDKVKFANEAAKLFNSEDDLTQFDLMAGMSAMLKEVRRWN